MLKFCYDHKGSISIFLLVIMVAMLVFSFMTLDIAKMNLATAAARNNTDLVGNAVLTDYDKLLKDAYGLFANSANIDELSKNVSDYYIATMSAGGVEIRDQNEIYAAISGLLNSAKIPDNNNMLQIKADSLTLGSNTSSSGVIIQPINESAISNPSVMRHQIVEYMKYRAPVSLATGMLEKINVFKDIGNQTKATTNRIEYENALNEVQTSSDVVYEVLNAYDNNIKISSKNYPAGMWIKYGAKDVQQISGFSDEGIDSLKSSYVELVKTLNQLAPLSEQIRSGKLCSKTVKINPTYPNNGVGDLKGLIDDIEECDTYRYLESLYEADSFEVSKYNANTFEFLRQSKYLYDGSSSGFSGSATDNIGKFYIKFFQLYYGILEDEEKLSETEKKSFGENRGDFEEVERMLVWMYGRPKTSSSSDNIKHKTSTTGKIDSFISNLHEHAESSYGSYQNCMYDITATIFYQKEMAKFMGGPNSPLNELKKNIASAKTKSTEWNKSIDNVQTASYKSSMQNTYNVEAENFKELDSNAVQQMIEMFQIHQIAYEDDYQMITEKYGKVGNVRTYTAKTDGSTHFEGMLPINDFSVNSYSFESLMRGIEKESGSSYGARENNWKLISRSRDVLTTSKPEYSTCLTAGQNKMIFDIVKKISEKNIIQDKAARKELKEKGEEDKKKVNEKKEELEKEQKTQEETSIGKEPKPSKSEKESGNYTGSMKDVSEVITFEQYIKSNATVEYEYGKSLNAVNIGSMDADSKGNYDTSNVTNLLSQIGDMFLNIAEASRDNFFVVEYLTGSFSCMTTGIKDGKGVPEKSMTGYVFSKENNKHYQAELEYILYGFDSEFANKTAAIATISAIRFALNLIYSFTDKEINMFTTSTASSLGAIFPFAIPVIKTVLHVLLSAAETSWDMLELSKGNSIPIYKSSKTWVCKATNIIGTVASEVAETAIGATTEALEDGISKYIDGKAEDFEEWIDGMVEQKKVEIRSLLEAKIITPINETATMLIADASKEADEIESALNNLVDTIVTNISDSSKQETQDNAVMSDIYEKIADYLRGNKTTVVKNVKALIANAKTNAKEYLQSFEDQFTNAVRSITKRIESVVDGATDKIKKMVKEAADEVKKAAVNGIDKASDKLLSAVNSKISAKLSGKRNVNINMGSGSGTSGGNSVLDSLLTMTYKDYLYLFLLLGMINGSDKELTRAAQLMQCNIQLRGEKGYDINKAVTMFNVYTSSKVKTSVIGRYADSNGFTMRNLSNGYYNIEIRSFAGY